MLRGTALVRSVTPMDVHLKTFPEENKENQNEGINLMLNSLR